MKDKLKIPYGYKFSYFVDEDEYIDFVYENGTEDKIIWREYKKDIVVIKEPSKQELKGIINKAINYIEHSWWLRTDQVYDTSKDLKGWEAEELLSILERGKE